MMRAALAAALLLAGVAAAEALDVGLDAYLQARQSGALGVVAGRVAAEPRTARGPVQPLAGATVALLPRSEAVLLRLEQLKTRSRDSAAAFAAAAPGMRRAQEGYESMYRPQNRLRAYEAVTIWLRTFTVAAGETATLELTDRNAWFRGVIEERDLDTGR
jgi:hypothetical protein